MNMIYKWLNYYINKLFQKNNNKLLKNYNFIIQSLLSKDIFVKYSCVL